MPGSLARSLGLTLCLWTFQGSSGLAAPSPKMLLEVADLSGSAISPDGRFVAFRQEQASVESNTYATSWYIAGVSGQSGPRRVADGGTLLRLDYGGAVGEPPQWSPNSQWIYYRALLNGEVQVWRAARDGSRSEAVTHDPADVEGFVLSPDGAHLLYTVGATRLDIRHAEDAEYDHGVLIDRTIPIGQNLYHSAYINGRLASIRMTGDWSSRMGLLDAQPKHQRIVDLADLSVRDADDLSAFAKVMPIKSLKAEPTPPEDFDVHVRSAATGAIAYLAREGDGITLRETASADAPDAVSCRAKSCNDTLISAIAWRPGHNQVVFTATDPDHGRVQSLRLWDIKSGAVRTLVQTDGLIGGGHATSINESCAVGEADAVCVTASADVPPRLERINIETGARQVLYDPNTDLAHAVGPRTQMLTWTDATGQSFAGRFFPPVVAKPGAPAPLFITYYGCSGYLRGGVGDEWPLATLAGDGVAALCIVEPGANVFHPQQEARYQMALSGVSAIIDQLGKRGVIDPHRVGMGGLSFGSEVVMWIAMKSDLLAAASTTSTSVTPSYYRFHSLQDGNFRSQLKSEWGLGAPEETPERWKLLSPAFQTGAVHVPLLMQMPEQEYLQTMDYFSPLANSSTPTEMYVFPNEPHQKFQPRHKLAAYERNLDWFRFWLQGYVDPDPRKAEQYRRWQAMQARSVAAGLHPGQGSTPRL